MSSRRVEQFRETNETRIKLTLDLDESFREINTGLPFFDHMLTSLSFHGQIGLKIEAQGDLDVDEHHLVEDAGIVLGDALHTAVEKYGPVMRFGSAAVPMDEALSEAVVDVSGRPYLVYTADYPQDYCGKFPIAMLNEFFYALAHHAGITLHAHCRYGHNSHHMAEALFKATGRAFLQAYAPRSGPGPASTKGVL
ncbi:MAG: imidazoleglycerol-phosphate dehydratase HisB [Sediminispirochaetaceae bacterium]